MIRRKCYKLSNNKTRKKNVKSEHGESNLNETRKKIIEIIRITEEKMVTKVMWTDTVIAKLVVSSKWF